MTITLLCLTATLTAPPPAQASEPPGQATMDEVPTPDEPVDVDKEMDEALPDEAKELERDMERSRARTRGKETSAPVGDREHQPAEQTSDSQEGSHRHGLMEQRYGTSPAKPGEKKETGDWADEERWERYKGRGPRRPGVRATAEKSEVFRRRRPELAFALGALIGFGAGQYYAGASRAGMIFSGVDAALVIGFVATTVALNTLVIEHDFRSGKSLARGDRGFGKRESRLYVASFVLAFGLVGSHIWQGVWSMKAAQRTNETLQGVGIGPTAGGGAVQLTLAF